ncbi:MAG: hypothetical protein PF638_15990 [Candidatus Delongbacteria bacterium]|jgi:hypothetical protein|nr:hypothetical protein [Candidatus Delongbacteria bacterium]
MNKRLIIAILTGSVLGVFCIIGINIRMGDQVTGLFLFSTWFNRVVMGLAIGLYTPKNKDLKIALIRGGLIGLVVSFSLYSATNFIDTPGFIAGIIYGIIIDISATKYDI